MHSTPTRIAGRAVLGAILLLSFVLGTASSASAAGYPRRIAIAPFAVLTKEDIGATVSVLPRLLASRLMALAGADVVLLPAGAPPEEKAREAKVPLLLQGTVSKLGKGYSIDAAVTELETGKSAGAFFAAAATEDDIIAQMGILSGEIAEKLFGVQGTSRAVASPAPVAAPSSGGTQAITAAPSTVAPGPVPAPAAPSAPPPAMPALAPVPAPAPSAPANGWVPSSLKQVGQSNPIADEVNGVVAGDVDTEGNGEVVAFGQYSIYVYRVKGSEVLPYTRITRGISHHFLNVDAVDLDGDGRKDLVVTDRNGENLSSFVLLRKGDGFVEIPGTIPYHLVALRDWNGQDRRRRPAPGFQRAVPGEDPRHEVEREDACGRGSVAPRRFDPSPVQRRGLQPFSGPPRKRVAVAVRGRGRTPAGPRPQGEERVPVQGKVRRGGGRVRVRGGDTAGRTAGDVSPPARSRGRSPDRRGTPWS